MGSEVMSAETIDEDGNKHLPLDKVRFLSLGPMWSDGTVDPTNAEGWLVSDKMESLIEYAIEEANEHDMETYIYECRPIRRVVRGKTRVINLKKK